MTNRSFNAVFILLQPVVGAFSIPGVEPSPLLLRQLVGLLDQPSITDMNEWQGKLKYSEKNLPQCRSVHHRSHMTPPGAELGSLRREAGDYSPGARQIVGRYLHIKKTVREQRFHLCT
jgi:hypothetical protein